MALAALYLVIRRLRFCRSHVQIDQVPLYLGDRVRLTVLPTPTLAVLPEMRATLRCVQARVLGGEGMNAKRTVSGFEIWEQTVVADARGLASGQPLDLEYALPQESRYDTTLLTESVPRYWELELTSDVAGVDYLATFLIPIYARASPMG